MSGKLKRPREQQALSLTDLAQKSGVNRITIHRIENGKQTPMPRTIRKLAEALQVRVEELTLNQGKSNRKKPARRNRK